MRSKIADQKYAKMVRLCRQMSPEERLTAFFNHSRSMVALYQAGARYRKSTAARALRNSK